MTQDSLALPKASLRRAMRAALEGLTPAEIARQSGQACERLMGLPEFQGAGLLLAYRSLVLECDPSQAVEEARRQGKEVAFPLCGSARSLELFVSQGQEAFRRGRYGIWEPIPERSRKVGPEELEFIILPGLAFDRNGNRLGRGAGYYDRLLPKTRAFLAGLCLDIQLVEAVPTGPLDVPLQAVAAPCGLFRR